MTQPEEYFHLYCDGPITDSTSAAQALADIAKGVANAMAFSKSETIFIMMVATCLLSHEYLAEGRADEEEDALVSALAEAIDARNRMTAPKETIQ